MPPKFILATMLGAVLTAWISPLPALAGDRPFDPDCRYPYCGHVNANAQKEPVEEGWFSRLKSIILPWSEESVAVPATSSQSFDNRKEPPDTASWEHTDQAIPNETAVELKLQIRELAEQLLVNRGSTWPMPDSALVVTTFVNLNQLYRTTDLGRLLAEQMIGELQKRGIDTIDVRLSNSLQIKEGYGEYGLSREMAELSYVHNAQARLVGTYSVADGQVVINARILHQEDGRVLSSGSIILPENRLIAELLQDSGWPVSPSRSVMVESFDMIDTTR